MAETAISRSHQAADFGGETGLHKVLARVQKLCPPRYSAHREDGAPSRDAGMAGGRLDLIGDALHTVAT